MPEGIWMAVFVSLWVLLLGQTVTLLFLSRHMANLYHMRSLFPDRGADASQEGLPLGTEAPPIEVMDLSGQPIRLGGPALRQRLLVFLAPHCPACRAAIRPLQMVRAEGADMVLLWSATRKRTQELAEEYQLQMPLVADEDLHLRQEFNVIHVPLAMVVDEQGRVVAKGFVQSLEQLEALLEPSAPDEAEAVESGTAPAAPLAVRG